MSIDKLVDRYFPVLDNGFIAVKEYMGSDTSIERAARTSYGKESRQVSSTRDLLRYLMRQRHTSPFEMCELVLHIGMPIFVARQWVRHRTASLNEYSGRYSVMPMLFYMPELEQVTKQATNNKQGRNNEQLSCNEYASYCSDSIQVQDCAQAHYEKSLGAGIAKEVARIDLPLSMYTYMYWKMDLHNLLHFLKLRVDPHAQYEIRQYANVIMGIVKEWVPLTFEAFMDYIINGCSFSKQEREHLLTGNFPDNMSQREQQEFLNKMNHDFIDNENFTLNIDNSYTYEHFEQLVN